MPGLELDNLTMAFGSNVLFSGLSAHVGPGEMLVVTGENGCGKSTLLKIAVGLLRPEQGRVRSGGTAGYAAPDANLYTELTGLENILFFAGLRGARVDADALTTRVGLSRRSGRTQVANYSSGMRQRLKLAVSLIGEPALLVWDEPTLALDAAGETCVEEILARHRSRGGAAVVATNDDRAAERWRQYGPGIRLGRA